MRFDYYFHKDYAVGKWYSIHILPSLELKLLPRLYSNGWSTQFLIRFLLWEVAVLFFFGKDFEKKINTSENIHTLTCWTPNYSVTMNEPTTVNGKEYFVRIDTAFGEELSRQVDNVLQINMSGASLACGHSMQDNSIQLKASDDATEKTDDKV